MIEEEAHDLNAADEEQSKADDFDERGLSESAKKKLEERKKKKKTPSENSKEGNPTETLAAGERKGLEPKWRKKIEGGYRLRFVMDSGAAKTIVPRDAIPGMKVKKSTGGSFRMANGNVIPNLGDSIIKGLGAINAHPTKIGTQVADVTKPLAAATEAVDAGRTIVLHRTGGIVKKLSPESEKKIRDIIKAENGPEVILERRGGAFTFDIDVQSQEADKWEKPKKTFKSAVRQSSDMDVSMVSGNRFDPLWDEEGDDLECQPCGAESRFHRR